MVREQIVVAVPLVVVVQLMPCRHSLRGQSGVTCDAPPCSQLLQQSLSLCLSRTYLLTHAGHAVHTLTHSPTHSLPVSCCSYLLMRRGPNIASAERDALTQRQRMRALEGEHTHWQPWRGEDGKFTV